MKRNRILLTSGGTGGHVFPAIATAYELSDIGYEVSFATDIRGEKYLEDKSFGYKIISSASPSGGLKQKIKFAFKTGIGVLQSLVLLIKLKPKAVVGYGGYPSFPAILAAKILGIKIILHEQNSVLGKTNVFLQKYADILITSFEETKFAKSATHIGNPVREEITPQDFPAQNSPINILITGGSQGAKKFSELFPSLFAGIGNLHVIQQAKQEDIEKVKAEYESLSISCEVKSFFSDIEKKIAQSHLVICRSGSSTIFELAVIGRAAIFIPLPSSADNHQVINAQNILKTGGAWLFEEKALDKKALAALINDLANNPEKLKDASDKIRTFAKPNAAKNLAKLIDDAII